MVTYPYAYMTYIVSLLAGLVGGISWWPPAYSLFLVCEKVKLLITFLILEEIISMFMTCYF